jgi:Asp-tRNA(Asn)/Glu-tRNA(Gln) amidotransferase A subunit family amidase
MPISWERMNASEKLDTLRAEVHSLKRVTDSVARRIEEIQKELGAVASLVTDAQQALLTAGELVEEAARGPSRTRRVEEDKNLSD